MRFHVRAIPASELRTIRTRGEDGLGNRLLPRPADGGEPLRCCLRDAAATEPVVLIGYRPSDRGGPYAETGPVFVHAQECPGYPDPAAYPAGFRARRQ